MPTYSCKVISEDGEIMFSRVTENSRMSCIKKLRRNGLIPITIIPIVTFGGNKDEKKSKRIGKNVDFNSDVFKRKNGAKKSALARQAKNGLWSLVVGDIAGIGKMPTVRDIRVFTQNFYLLKKANFNNIHALSTVIQSTENARLRIILEDILAGVEAR